MRRRSGTDVGFSMASGRHSGLSWVWTSAAVLSLLSCASCARSPLPMPKNGRQTVWTVNVRPISGRPELTIDGDMHGRIVTDDVVRPLPSTVLESWRVERHVKSAYEQENTQEPYQVKVWGGGFVAMPGGANDITTAWNIARETFVLSVRLDVAAHIENAILEFPCWGETRVNHDSAGGMAAPQP